MLKLLALLLLTLSGCLVQAGGSVCYRGSYAYECSAGYSIQIQPQPLPPVRRHAVCALDSQGGPVPLGSPATFFTCSCDSGYYFDCFQAY